MVVESFDGEEPSGSSPVLYPKVGPVGPLLGVKVGRLVTWRDSESKE